MSTIKLFGKAIAGPNVLTFAQMNEQSMKVGYIVHPDCCTREVLSFIEAQGINYNATFYKTWNDITSKNRFDLYLDQIRHYASTYGTNFTGQPFVVNDGAETIAFKDFKVITPITMDEINERCCQMLYSGIALSKDTLSQILSLVTSVDMNKVKNKEALMSLHKKFGTLPNDPMEFVRFLVFLHTGETLLIKDKKTITSLKVANTIKAVKIDLEQMINTFGIEKLSEVFFRFKPLFLALKKGNENIINKLRRSAEKHHKPMQVGFFEAILSNPSLITQLPEKLENCSNFKKILLLETILIREKELDMRFFGIRNGKLWAKNEKTVNKSYYKLLFTVIYDSLIEALKPKATSVKIPKGINITLPTSEKSFVGNYPLGTSFDLADTDSIVGIHWKSEEGANDIDLSLIDLNNRKIGWNSSYTNAGKSLIYSGDMTSAYPEAVELIYASQGFNPSIVKVNLFSGAPNSKFRFFLATEKITNMSRNYMVDPNHIKFMIDCEMDGREKSLGVITENRFIISQFKTGNKHVAGDSITNKYTEYALATTDCHLNLEKVLSDAGFTINTGNEAIDLTNLSKDSLISLLA